MNSNDNELQLDKVFIKMKTESPCNECAFLVKVCDSGTSRGVSVMNAKFKSGAKTEDIEFFPLAFNEESVLECGGFIPKDPDSLTNSELVTLMEIYKLNLESGQARLTISMNDIRSIALRLEEDAKTNENIRNAIENMENDRNIIIPMLKEIIESVYAMALKREGELIKKLAEKIKEKFNNKQ